MKRRGKLETRLSQLQGAYDLSDAAINALRVLLDLLAEDEAPTTVHDPVKSIDVHIADSLSGLDVAAVRSAAKVADLGSGAGLPALVLAAARPEARFHAVESVGRKAAFIARAAEAMGLGNLDVAASRAEEWSPGSELCNVVCARALAALPVLVEYAAPLLRHGGVLVAWKATVAEDERRDGDAAALAVGMRLDEIVEAKPFESAENRTLHVYSKVAETPAKYPRRAGIATKRPLRAN